MRKVDNPRHSLLRPGWPPRLVCKADSTTGRAACPDVSTHERELPRRQGGEAPDQEVAACYPPGPVLATSPIPIAPARGHGTIRGGGGKAVVQLKASGPSDDGSEGTILRDPAAAAGGTSCSLEGITPAHRPSSTAPARGPVTVRGEVGSRIKEPARLSRAPAQVHEWLADATAVGWLAHQTAARHFNAWRATICDGSETTVPGRRSRIWQLHKVVRTVLPWAQAERGGQETELLTHVCAWRGRLSLARKALRAWRRLVTDRMGRHVEPTGTDGEQLGDSAGRVDRVGSAHGRSPGNNFGIQRERQAHVLPHVVLPELPGVPSVHGTGFHSETHPSPGSSALAATKTLVPSFGQCLAGKTRRGPAKGTPAAIEEARSGLRGGSSRSVRLTNRATAREAIEQAAAEARELPTDEACTICCESLQDRIMYGCGHMMRHRNPLLPCCWCIMEQKDEEEGNGPGHAINEMVMNATQEAVREEAARRLQRMHRKLQSDRPDRPDHGRTWASDPTPGGPWPLSATGGGIAFSHLPRPGWVARPQQLAAVLCAFRVGLLLRGKAQATVEQHVEWVSCPGWIRSCTARIRATAARAERWKGMGIAMPAHALHSWDELPGPLRGMFQRHLFASDLMALKAGHRAAIKAASEEDAVRSAEKSTLPGIDVNCCCSHDLFFFLKMIKEKS